MSTETTKNNCCQGCKNGQPGQNKTCQVKRMLEQLEKNKEVKTHTEV